MTGISRRSMLGATAAVTAAGCFGITPDQARAACCYFAAKDKDINQPAQKAFLNWTPDEQRESFTVQPKFEGNAEDFGMVIPTPSRPRLDEIPRDFFKLLAVFTILEPMPLEKYKNFKTFTAQATAGAGPREMSVKPRVRVLEAGIVGSLDYKIILAEDAKGLYQWLDEHKYNYAGDEATLDHYIQKKWIFTVMKIDPKQMKRRPDGSYEGDITPTRFTFTSSELIYPLRITKLSVKERTEALFYVQAPKKMDLADSFSYQFTWQAMWAQACQFQVSRSQGEEAWLKYITPLLAEYQQRVVRLQQDGLQPATLEWTNVISDKELGILDGTKPYNRDAPAEDVAQLKVLRGHVEKGKVLTKFRKVFHTREMNDDLLLTRAKAGVRDDDTAYYEILPTSPP